MCGSCVFALMAESRKHTSQHKRTHHARFGVDVYVKRTHFARGGGRAGRDDAWADHTHCVWISCAPANNMCEGRAFYRRDVICYIEAADEKARWLVVPIPREEVPGSGGCGGFGGVVVARREKKINDFNDGRMGRRSARAFRGRRAAFNPCGEVGCLRCRCRGYGRMCEQIVFLGIFVVCRFYGCVGISIYRILFGFISSELQTIC